MSLLIHISFFIFSLSVSISLQAMQDNAGHKKNLETKGYSTFDIKNCPFGNEHFDRLNQIFSSKSLPRGCPRPGAYDVAIAFYATNREGTSVIEDITTPFIYEDTKYILDHIAAPVIGLLPKANINTKRYFSVVFVDDFRVLIEDNEEKLRKASVPQIAHVNSLALPWHQDSFFEQTFRYLAFVVTHQYGVSEHFLELGTVKEELYFSGKKALEVNKQEKVTLLESFKSQSGSGYIIDQEHPIVHRHTDYCSYISNFAISEENIGQLIPDRAQELLKISDNNIDHPNYKTPRRYKIIVRTGDEMAL